MIHRIFWLNYAKTLPDDDINSRLSKFPRRKSDRFTTPELRCWEQIVRREARMRGLL